MNNQTNEILTISITGVLSIGRQELEKIQARCLAQPEVNLVSVKTKFPLSDER